MAGNASTTFSWVSGYHRRHQESMCKLRLWSWIKSRVVVSPLKSSPLTLPKVINFISLINEPTDILS